MWLSSASLVIRLGGRVEYFETNTRGRAPASWGLRARLRKAAILRDIGNAIIARILDERHAEETRRRQGIEDRIAAGPPAGMQVSHRQWGDWCRYGWIVCPGEKRDLTCHREECAAGAKCQKLQALGLDGGGNPLALRQRPRCKAKTRAGGECAVRVEAGKRRCRFHGGKSTGPRTAEGRARIAEAQRRRWVASENPC